MAKLIEILKNQATAADVKISEDVEKIFQNEQLAALELPDEFWGSVSNSYVLKKEADSLPDVRQKISKQTQSENLAELLAKAKEKLNIDDTTETGIRGRHAGGVPMGTILEELFEMNKNKILNENNIQIDERVKLVEAAKTSEIQKLNNTIAEMATGFQIKEAQYAQRFINRSVASIALSYNFINEKAPENVKLAGVYVQLENLKRSHDVDFVQKDDDIHVFKKGTETPLRINDQPITFTKFTQMAIESSGCIVTGSQKTNPANPEIRRTEIPAEQQKRSSMAHRTALAMTEKQFQN